jgi:hypothetical protein
LQGEISINHDTASSLLNPENLETMEICAGAIAKLTFSEPVGKNFFLPLPRRRPKLAQSFLELKSADF